MKQIIRRLSDSAAKYEPLRRPGKDHHQRRRRRMRGDNSSEHSTATSGRVPVYVGEEMVRFELPAKLLNRPAIVELLRRSAEEYGYGQQGVLRIPCSVHHFRQVLADAGGSVGLSTEEDEQLLQSWDEEGLLLS